MPHTLRAPQPFATFMAESLYGPQGYYTLGHNFLSVPPRDFVTAPELTPLFGATLGNWVARQWQALGAPAGFNLTELGPGRGSLMRGLLTHLQHAHAVCFTALQQVVLVEVSPALSALQQQTLKDFNQCRWAQKLPTTNCQLPTLLIANEVLDALPVQPYRLITEGSATGWEELWVEAIPDTTRAACHPEQREGPRSLPQQPGSFVSLRMTQENTTWRSCNPPPLPANWHPSVGAVYEHMPALSGLLNDIKTHTTAALLIDYGYHTLPPTGADTLQALHQHQKVDLLHVPTDTDLTAHVNFGAVLAQLKGGTLTPLADFLLQHGLPDLALPLLPHPPTESALHRLLHPAQMGKLHKVLCFTRSTP